MDRFRALVQDLQTRSDLESLFGGLKKHGPLIQDRVDEFLRDTQGVDPRGIFESYAQDGVWTLDSLSRFLASSKNAKLPTTDMTRPITEYFISSSHNTYLVGEQWRGESTVEGYIRVLLANCRCVESEFQPQSSFQHLCLRSVDVHDGDDEPVAHHRVTLTSSVSVRTICKAIKKYAFINSPYPIIISAETRCSPEQGTILATIMKEEFGSALITEAADERPTLPSPEELKHKILFKVSLNPSRC